jgi:hypothetical protein
MPGHYRFSVENCRDLRAIFKMCGQLDEFVECVIGRFEFGIATSKDLRFLLRELRVQIAADEARTKRRRLN